MPTPSAAFFLFSFSLNTCPCRCSFFPFLFCRASPFFSSPCIPLHTLSVISPLRTPPLFSLLPLPFYRRLHSFFPLSSIACCPFSSLLPPLFSRRPQLSFLPSLSPVRRFLNVILNLFQDLIILFIRLSLFVKCMRCRNEFGMTIRCVWATKPPPPLP